ncbi:unnamed protein product, partial [Dovyalis caffra]
MARHPMVTLLSFDADPINLAFSWFGPIRSMPSTSASIWPTTSNTLFNQVTLVNGNQSPLHAIL